MGWWTALLAAGACAAAGHGASVRLERRERLLREWEEALSRMEREVQRGGAAVTEVLRRGAGERVETLKRLAELVEASPAQAPEDAIACLAWDPLFTPSEREILRDGLMELFSPDPETQLRGLGCAREEWAACCRSARAQREKDCRLYLSLGWLAGAGAFILLC